MKQNPVVSSDRVFYGAMKKGGIMWFIIVVLLITVILNSVNGEKEIDNEENNDLERNRVVHPAEYLMR